MTKDEALKLAMEVLENINSADNDRDFLGAMECCDLDNAITAIKEALAQPEYQSTADKSKLEKVPAKGTLLAQTEQEPVKFEAVWDSGPTNKDYEDAMRLKRLQQLTTPPQRTWVGLTDEEVDQGLLRSDYAFKTAEAWRAGVVFAMTKLKEKNT